MGYSMIKLSSQGDYSKLTNFLQKALHKFDASILDKYGRRGVAALQAATPIDSGLASESWYYEIEQSSDGAAIYFCNNDIENGFPVAIMLQYGHGTGTGGWVEGRDYINPAIQPVFDEIVQECWKEVTSL